MTDYTNTFGGAAKDAADDPANATDLDTEFDAIATAVASKANKAKVEATGDVSAGDNAAMGYDSVNGLLLTGQGSTNDIMIYNDAKASVIRVPTGTVDPVFAGDITAVNGTFSGTLDVTGDSTLTGDLLGGANLVGQIVMWPTDTAPTGYLECDGSAVSRTTYAALFAVLASTYGDGDGSTTFNLPDLRGEFVRGWDNGAGTDPDAASRTDRGDTTTGDNVGTKQADEFKSHTHNVAAYTASSPVSPTGTAQGKNAAVINYATSSSGGNETRPTNVNMMYIIRY